ncbi:hypothetical protein [Pedobacter duraquae]|uniref:Uncharacterized protein n=1 Tax=Pedobacter duraquae TaxID=425511 RepID=A0A4R6IDX7_9SPHI|nr:hypothetical protein [Pedobacter duraquae]TDO20232.1 hypothetical protein CLV32_3992 [Pedobacter duraquae]
MKRILLLICFSILVCACKKNPNHDSLIEPANTKGSLSGILLPLGASANIYATDVQGKIYTASVNTVVGSFQFDQLPAGDYQLSVPPSTIYYPLTNRSVRVLAGQTIGTGPIMLDQVPGAMGSVSGTLLPVGSGTSVTATNKKTGQAFVVIPEKAYGGFNLGLPSGDYTLSFTVAAPLESPDEVSITISGKPVSLGTMNCKPGNSGSITGSFNPVASAATIQAIHNLSGTVTSGFIDRYKNTLFFPVLLPGTYTIKTTAYTPYLSPADITAVVTKGNTTDVGMITLPYNTDVRILSYKMNGLATVRYNPPATFIDGVLKFSVSTSNPPATPESRNSSSTAMVFSLDGITGPGKYNFTGTNVSNMSYTATTSNGYSKTVTNWGVYGPGASAQVEITAIDAAKRTIKGKYAAVLVADKIGTANKSITEGEFYLNY